MRICHWCVIEKGKISGLHERVKELHKNELAMGLDSGICSPDRNKKKGEKLVNPAGEVIFDIKSWEWAKEADINVIGSHIPELFESLKNRVFITHGTPESCTYGELGFGQKVRSSLSTAINAIHDCELTICWSKRQHRIWKMYDEKNSVKFVQGGIDLERWNVNGPKIVFIHHPTVVFMSMWRPFKLPFTLMYAVKKAHRQIGTLRLQLFNIPASQQLFWMKFICKLNMDKLVENFVLNPLKDPTRVYRGADMLVETDPFGDISGTAAEAMACGCPVLLANGEEFANMKYKYGFDGLAEAMVKLWHRMKNDPEKERKRARKTAEKHYNIKHTIKGMMKLYKEFFNVG